MDLVADQQVEEALHPVLHVVRQRVAGGVGLVGLPQGAAAAGAGVLAAVQVGVRERHAVLVHDLRRAVGAAGDAEGLPRLLVPPEETAALIQCLEDETLLRLFLTGLIGQTGPLSAET